MSEANIALIQDSDTPDWRADAPGPPNEWAMTLDLTPAPIQRHTAGGPRLPHEERTPLLQAVSGSYRLRFAQDERDLEAVRRLRFEVFNLELGEGLPESYVSGLDEDEYDLQCQHLLVEHVQSGACVGTYRMQTLEAALEGRGWYSGSEFDLAGLPVDDQAQLVELGRACVAKGHRDRRTLFLLWQGLIAYAQHNGRSAMFGCSSLTSQDPAVGLRFAQQLAEAGRMHPTLRVAPRAGYECEATPEQVAAIPEVETPRLFASYLRYGATILGPPARDRVFGTLDFLTHVQLDEGHLRRFGGLGAP